MRGFKNFKKIVSLLIIVTMMQGNYALNVSAEKQYTEQKTNTYYEGKELKPLTDGQLEDIKLDSKLDSKLLKLTGKQNPDDDKTIEELKKEMKSSNQLITKGSYAKNIEGKAVSDMVYVYIKTKTSEGDKTIEQYTFKIVNKDMTNKLLTAWVNVDKLQQLEALDEVIKVETVIKPKVNVDSEGDQFHRANLVRSLSSGSSGSGMKVGVISDGVDHLNDSISKGALPEKVTVLSNKVSGDEGTAMLEIVHTLAPGADLYFNDCGQDEIAFNKAVDNLVAAGCNIIVDDISWITEPFFEDGIIASHIKQVINSTGIFYTSSAGNSGLNHYSGLYYNDGNNSNDFSSGKDSNYKYMYVRIAPGKSTQLVLQWDDQFNNSSNDYDLYLRDMNGNIIGASNVKQKGSGSSPLEYIEYTNNTSSDIDARIDVKNINGAAAPKTLNLYIYGQNYKNNVVPSDSIFGQAAVSEVVTAGAIEVSAPTQVAGYSSQGPVVLLNGDKRNKPDICGAAGVSVTGAGGFPSTFSGTSAAAPHIAAIAALLWSKNPKMTNAQVRGLIVNNATDIGAAGYDNVAGSGKADAYDSFLAIKPVAISKIGASTYKGFKVNLDGKDSKCRTGAALTYKWSIKSKPVGSNTQIMDSASATPYVIPDVIGEYQISLIVNDGIHDSDETFSVVKAKDMSDITDDINISSADMSINSSIGKNVIKKPITLSDGWIITADDTNKIKIVNVFTGEVGKQYQVSAVPNCIDFDFDKKIIIASLNDVNMIAKIDVNKDEISYIATPFNYKGIVYGENNYAFAITEAWTSGYISTIDILNNKVISSLPVSIYGSGPLAYDKNKNNLLTIEQGLSPSSLYRYSFDEITGQLVKQQEADLGENGLDLSISPDGKHIAFCCGGGNGDGYTIFDIDSSDINNKFGEWNTGSYPTSAAFTPDNKYLAASNGEEIKIFDVQTHCIVKNLKRVGSIGEYDKVQFSRGGKIIYDFTDGKVVCYKNDIVQSAEDSNIVQPIVPLRDNLITYKGVKVGFDTKYSSTISKCAIISKPQESKAGFISDANLSTYFIPDVIGEYKISYVENSSSDKIITVRIKEMNSTVDDISVNTANTAMNIYVGSNVTAKPIALSDGWVITADDANKIKIINLFSGDVAKQYQVTSAPNCVDFDFDNNIIVASLKGANKVVKIDINKDAIVDIFTPYSYEGIVLGNNGCAFAITKSWINGNISTIDILENKVVNNLSVSVYEAGLMAYDKNRNNLVIAERGLSSSDVIRYSFDVDKRELKQEQRIESEAYGSDLSISPDGKHIAFCCGGGTVTGETLYDIDSSNLNNKFGEWNIGASPTAASFTADSKYIITSNGDNLKLFSVQNHNLLRSYSKVNTNGYGKVIVSRGGNFIYCFDSGIFNCFKSGILKGDINCDNIVDIKDLASAASNYNIKHSDTDKWDYSMDLNQDDIIDIFDLVGISKNIK